MSLSISQGCGRELFEKGFLLVECYDAELVIPKQNASGSCGQTNERDTGAKAVANLCLSNKDRKCIQDLICITKNWFDHGMMRELFTLEVRERHSEESGGSREIVRLGHSLSLRASRKASLGVPNELITEGIQSCVEENHTAYSLCGVESFIVRLPLRIGTPFPWPVTMPHMEQTVTEAFHILENISWVFFREACKEAIGRFSAQRSVDSTNFLKDTFGDVCANGKSADTPAKTGGDSYTSSILFLRNYIGKRPTAEAHTDSGIVTLIPFYEMGDIEGLELFTNEKGSTESLPSKEWVDASSFFPNYLRESHSLKFVVLIGEMGEAMLRSLLSPQANSHIHSIAALHRVDSKSALSPNVERNRRITTPFQLRIPFENVPGFVGFDTSSAKMITL